LPYRMDIPGQVSEAQLQAIEAVATLVPENGCVVEIGSLFGRSSWAWSRSVPETATVICVDPWEGNEGAHAVGRTHGVRYGFESFADFTRGCDNIVPIRAYSPEGVSWSRPIDCYYEDAVHTNPILGRNIAFWTSFLRPTGIACGDDYRPRFPDVRAAAARLAAELGRELIIVDFFWCLLPNPADVPGVTEVAERLRAIAAEMAEAQRQEPAVVRIAPLVPLPATLPAGQPLNLKMRVTNDGAKDWPDAEGQPLSVRVTHRGLPDGQPHTFDIPLGRTRLGTDEAFPFDMPLAGTALDAAKVEIECVIRAHEDDARVTSFRHVLTVDSDTAVA